MKKFKKNAILTAIILVIALAIFLLNINSGNRPVEDNSLQIQFEVAQIIGNEQITENDFLALYVNGKNAEISVYDKLNDFWWHSNPPSKDENESLQGLFKSKVNSQLSLEYYESNKHRREMNSFNTAVEEGNFSLFNIENGIRVEYRFGNEARGIESLPGKISKERYDTLIIDKLQDNNDIREMGRRYVFRAEQELYELRDIPTHTIPNVLEILDKVGYTLEDLAYDNEQFGIDTVIVESPFFTIPIEYRIDGKDFTVKVPASDIKYSKAHTLTSINLLEFFGAAKTGDEGYFLLPDGSGAIIGFDRNFNEALTLFSGSVYGRDISIPQTQQTAKLQPVRLPIFGKNAGSNGFFAIIESGDAIGKINAGTIAGYYNAYPSFNINLQDLFRIGEGYNEVTLPAFQKSPYKGDIIVRYIFLDKGKSDFVSMADKYRNYLIKNNLINDSKSEEAYFILETMGVYDMDKSFLGIPYTGKETMTTFEQANDMLTKLSADGVENIALKFTGWFNGGMNNKIANRINIENSLGSNKDFDRLFSETSGVKIYPEVSFTKINSASLGFIPRFHGARNLSNQTVRNFPYNTVTRMMEAGENNFMLSPFRVPSIVENFISASIKREITRISVSDMGKTVYSDLAGDNIKNREETKVIFKDAFESINKNSSLMISGGNSYSLKFADIIVEAPLTSSGLDATGEGIPFYQMVVHGIIDYAGSPLNLSEDYDTAVLQTVQTGAIPYFLLTHENSSNLKDTVYSYLFSTYFDHWSDRINNLHLQIGDFVKDVSNERITEYEVLADGVYKTGFSNGTSVIVNYTYTDYMSDGVMVDSRGFTVKYGRGNS